MTGFQLTDQQQAVVNHNRGPALVFAVAGAGKTTSILYRLERLAREGIFPAHQILTTSFGVNNIRDLKEGLAQWPSCQKVDVRTLHSLGWRIIRQASRLGLIQLNQGSGDVEDSSRQLYFRALGVARQRQVDFVDELNQIDQEDFLSFVGACKGNLAYADLDRAELPAGASLATQAKPPRYLKWYLDLYQIFEGLRREANLITFDDMLMTSWELLHRHPDLLDKVRGAYQAIIVDEFQDVNLAQSAILDLLAAEHKNLMVVGDDDQTIYEWRGASPKFILNFATRYQADSYVISENFRCPAGPLLLANRVIHHNKQRKAKQLQLTKGFGGRLSIRGSANVTQMGHDIAAEIGRCIKQGVPPEEIAILVRLNGQSPPIEQGLIYRDIAYTINQPFYERIEITTIISYIRLAWLENRMRLGETVNQTMGKSAAESWQQVANRPKRYLSRDIVEDVAKRLRRLTERPTLAIHRAAAAIRQEWKQTNLLEAADHIQWLSKQLDQKAYRTLRNLEARLDYLRFLRENSGFVETGEGRAASVEAFLQFSRQQGTTLDLMQVLRTLAQERAADQASGKPAITITTIHQAKGLEWPMVFIPQCNDGIMPFQGDFSENPEEERRLMYVALTRSSRDLLVYTSQAEPESPYIKESGWSAFKDPLRTVRSLLDSPADEWTNEKTKALLQHVTNLGLTTYFHGWWRPNDALRSAIQQSLINIQTDAPQALKAYSPVLVSLLL